MYNPSDDTDAAPSLARRAVMVFIAPVLKIYAQLMRQAMRHPVAGSCIHIATVVPFIAILMGGWVLWAVLFALETPIWYFAIYQMSSDSAASDAHRQRIRAWVERWSID